MGAVTWDGVAHPSLLDQEKMGQGGTGEELLVEGGLTLCMQICVILHAD